MKQFALVTGASSGIGLELAKVLAAEKINLILVARRLEKLQALKIELESEHGITVFAIKKDLSRPENCIELYNEIKAKELEVSILINNAGFGGYGEFNETALERELEMIELNIASVVVLTKLFLHDMKARNSGRIMNLGSLLSFFPFPTLQFMLLRKPSYYLFQKGSGPNSKTPE